MGDLKRTETGSDAEQDQEFTARNAYGLFAVIVLAVGGDLITGMVGMLVDAGIIISLVLFDCCPLLPELFKQDDLNSSKLNSGNAAAEVSAVSLQGDRKNTLYPLVRMCTGGHRKLTWLPVAPNSIVRVCFDVPARSFQ